MCLQLTLGFSPSATCFGSESDAVLGQADGISKLDHGTPLFDWSGDRSCNGFRAFFVPCQMSARFVGKGLQVKPPWYRGSLPELDRLKEGRPISDQALLE